MANVFQILDQRRSEIGAAWTEKILVLARKDSSSALTVKMLKSEASEFLAAFLKFLEHGGYDTNSSHFSSVAELVARNQRQPCARRLDPDRDRHFRAFVQGCVASGDGRVVWRRPAVAGGRIDRHQSRRRPIVVEDLRRLRRDAGTDHPAPEQRAGRIVDADPSGLAGDPPRAARRRHRHQTGAAGDGRTAYRHRKGARAGRDTSTSPGSR